MLEFLENARIYRKLEFLEKARMLEMLELLEFEENSRISRKF